MEKGKYSKLFKKGPLVDSKILIKRDGDKTIFVNSETGDCRIFSECEELGYDNNGIKGFKGIDEYGREVFIAQEEESMTVMERSDAIAIWRFMLDHLPQSAIIIEHGVIKIKPEFMIDIENRIKIAKELFLKKKKIKEVQETKQIQEGFAFLEMEDLMQKKDRT